jgi:hypothetical protein
VSRQAQAEREKESRVILGGAEAAIVAKFVEAAKTCGSDPLRLRAMNISSTRRPKSAASPS